MKYTIIFLGLCLIVFLLFSCKTKQYALEEYTDSQITFGSGGGFTGMYNHYILFENGQLFKKEGQEEKYMAMTGVKKKEAKQLFESYKVLNLAEVQLNEPGNMSYYIEYKNSEGAHKITWGGNNKKASEEVKLFYQLLNRLLKSSSVEE